MRARNFYIQVKDEISKLNFEALDDNEVLEKKKRSLLNRLKRDIEEKLFVSAALATGLDFSFGQKKIKVLTLAKKFRSSNLLNYNMVAYPLINYSLVKNDSLIEMNLETMVVNNIKVFDFDEFKLEWSPRYIHSIEFFIADLWYRFYSNNKIVAKTNKLFNKYIECNNLGEYLQNSFKIEKISEYNEILNYRYVINDNSNKNPKVAVVNTKIFEKDILSSVHNQTKKLTLDNKLRLFKILNIAKEEKVDILVFPEFYFPTSWLMDIAVFAIKNHISIVTGLQYITLGNRAFNNVCNVIPAVIGKSFVTWLLLVREKKYYAPKEKIELSHLGYKCEDITKPVYYVVDNGKYRYSTILCYEFTDILSRASIKSQIEALFVPQLNRDTNYFSAIVEASARDLHCFVIQANTAAYGDSRITAPYVSAQKNILQIKGGETDVVMIVTLDMEGLLKKRKNYPDKLGETIKACLKCAKSRNKNKPYGEIARKCEKCKKLLKDEYIKGTPPNFRP